MTDAVKAVGSLVNGAAGYEAGKYNKKVAEQNAISAEREGAANVERIREAARQSMGAQIGAQAANGFQIGTGSALDSLTESQINATLDALNARREAQGRAIGYRIQGAQAMAAGKNAFTADMFNAASTVLDYRTDWAQNKSGTAPAPSANQTGIVVNQGAIDNAMRKVSANGY